MALIQKLRILLDRAALADLQKEAAAASAMVAQQLTKELGAGKSAEQAVLKYATRLRATFEKMTAQLRENLAKGLISQEQAEASAKQFADKFTGKLAQELKATKGLTRQTREAVMEMAIPKDAELAMAVDKFSSRLANRLNSKVTAIRSKLNALNNPDLMKIPTFSEVRSNLSKSKEMEFFKMAKGDRSLMNQYISEYVNQIRASKATLTESGELLKRLGFNVRGLSQEYAELGVRVPKATTSFWAQIKAGNLLGAGVQGLTGIFKGFAGQLTAVTVAYKAVQFAQESVKTAAETEATYSRLSVILADFGIKIREVWPEVKQLTDRLGGYGYNPTFTAEVLGTLVSITGDYQKSLKAVPTVLDLVVEKHWQWELAARSVGRAIIGDSTNLQRHGIFLDKTRDQLQQLIERFGGAAAARSNTLQGTLDRISVAWWRIHRSMGAVIARSATTSGTTNVLMTVMEQMNAVIEQSSGMIDLLMAGLRGLLGIMAVIAVMARGFMTSFNIVANTVYSIVNLIPLIWAGLANGADLAMEKWTVLWRGMYDIALAGVEKVAKLFDKITGNKFGWAAQVQEIRRFNAGATANATAGGDKRRRDSMNEATQTYMDRVKGAWGSMLPQDEDSLLQDIPIGTAGKIKAREEQQIRQRILALRKNALSNDKARSDEAMAALDKMYSEQQKRLGEIDPKNEGKKIDVENHLTAIEKIREDLAKKQKNDEKAANADSERRDRIALLRKVALLDKDKERNKALAELGKIQDHINGQLKVTNVMSERYFVLQEQSLEIDKIRSDVKEKDLKALETEIEHLDEMVELDVDREKSMLRLAVIRDDLHKRAKDQTKTEDERLRIAKMLLATDKAYQLQDDRTDKEMDLLAEQLKNGDKRRSAEERLLSIKAKINRELTTGNITSERELRLRQQMLKVEELLEGRISIRSMKQAVGAIGTMIKTPGAREKALKANLELQEKITAALQKEGFNTEDLIQLNAILLELKKQQHKLTEPLMGIKEGFLDSIATDGPQIALDAAAKVATAWESSFSRIFSSAKNLGRNMKAALADIPKSMLAALTGAMADIAKKHVTENVAFAIEQTAKGFGALGDMDAPAAGAYFKSAAEHLAAAAAWGALGGASAAATGGLSGGRGGQGSGAKADKSQTQVGPEITIVIDGVDPKNPRHQALLGQTMRKYQERYGVPINVVQGNGGVSR